MNLRQLARNKQCQIRLEGCTGGPTVLAHFRLSGTCGVGMRPSDLAGAWSCPACHDIVDGRTHTPAKKRDEVRLAHACGVIRTLNELRRLGLTVNVPEEGF